ncbi:uncharacterized protein B0H18DRAFT_1213290 [Fomitopsis serialis]|uniref:uncharacterized protein n=1 Tax=Fomitopsis serialis TaxID=139415 RepID=UPI002008CDDA|nr:uncharacterized protein B0H18DRAFT_1213290 [Neoantrodia serialis]KAH9920589.1 hypothetical protein B0H18DRAFT_1213290 [Neoantrodia serialis]
MLDIVLVGLSVMTTVSECYLDLAIREFAHITTRRSVGSRDRGPYQETTQGHTESESDSKSIICGDWESSPELSGRAMLPPIFEGKVILITGAGSGIGRATAIKLAKLGARLAITDIDLGGAVDTYHLCGGKPHYTGVMDVSSKVDVERRIAEIVSGLGRLDHVFNCAGINPTSIPLTETTDEYWDKLVNVNLKGIYLVTRATIPHLTTPGGSYVNVSSICGLHPQAEQAIYTTGWHARQIFVKSAIRSRPHASVTLRSARISGEYVADSSPIDVRTWMMKAYG